MSHAEGAQVRELDMRTLSYWPGLLGFVVLMGCGDDADPSRATGDAGSNAVTMGDASNSVADPVGQLDESHLTLEVPLRGKGKQPIHAMMWSGGAESGATVLAVHGLSESAAVYGPLAKAMIKSATWQKRVRRLIAIDMPGHGKSDFPSVEGGPTFGELAIEDYVGIVIDAVRALRERDLGPSVAIGHSMGGLELQAAQEQLLASNSSFAALGVKRVVLLSPVPAHGRPWMVPMSGDLSAFVVQDAKQGAYLELPAALFVAQSFGKLDASVAADAPTPEQATAAGYPAREPMSVLGQLLEAPVMLPNGMTLMPKRPSVSQGAYQSKNGTALELASFSQDVLVRPSDLMMLATFLAGESASAYVAVEADNAVHNMFVSDPEGVLKALKWADLP